MINACWQIETLSFRVTRTEQSAQPRLEPATRIAQRRLCKRKRVARLAAAVIEAPPRPAETQTNQLVREGHYEQPLVEHQVLL